MTTILEQGNISIHTENIFPIIKKALYSEHEIFLRELVSNAVDAIKKLSMVARSGEYPAMSAPPKSKSSWIRTRRPSACRTPASA
jgi:molecular chaperone HtpG